MKSFNEWYILKEQEQVSSVGQTPQIGQDQDNSAISRTDEQNFIRTTLLQVNDENALTDAFRKIMVTTGTYYEQSPAQANTFITRMLNGFKSIGEQSVFYKYLNDFNNMVNKGRWPKDLPDMNVYNGGWQNQYETSPSDNALDTIRWELGNIDSVTGFSNQAQRSVFGQ